MSSPDTTALISGQPGYGNHAAEQALRTQGEAHLAHTREGMRVWVVTTGMEQAKSLLADTKRYSKESALLISVIREQLKDAGEDPDEVKLSGMYGRSMMYSDGEDHTRLRRLVAKSFNAAQVARLRPRVWELTLELLAELPTGVPLDLVAEFSYKLPITVVCELLGVPLEDRDKVHAWTAALVLDDRSRTIPASEAMAAYLNQLIARTREHPDDGLISALVHASTEGDELTAEELMAQLFLLVVGGHETTSSLIANAMYALLVQPDRWRSLVADPTLAAAAVEETLRFDAPTRNTTHRVTLEDIQIGDTVIPAKQIVMVSLSAAGRDPSITDAADEFDLHRPTRQHLAFGHGPHNCPGRLVALMQAETALTELATRFPNTRLIDPLPPRLQSSIVGGVSELRLVLE